MSWRKKAACLKHVTVEKKTDYWDRLVNDRHGEAYVSEAKRICFECPVRDECLEDAVVNRETYGIRGGFTPLERKRLTPEMVGAYSWSQK